MLGLEKEKNDNSRNLTGLALLASMMPAAGETTPAPEEASIKVSGVARDSNGKVLANATINPTLAKENVTNSTTTDTYGNFTLFLKLGTFSIKILKADGTEAGSFTLTITSSDFAGIAVSNASGVSITVTAVTGVNSSGVSTSTAASVGNILKTGQTKCFNASDAAVDCSSTYVGQDAQENKGLTRSLLGPLQFGDTTDYTTTDLVTGLVWKTCVAGRSGADCATGTSTETNFATATTACSDLNSANGGVGYGGKTNWRLPTKMEAESLVDFGYSPTRNPIHFPQLSGFIWTTTQVYAADPNTVWGVGFTAGNTISTAKTATLLRYALCVASGTNTISYSYTNNGDGTIKDNRTGLTWQRCHMGTSGTNCTTTTGGPYTWNQAITECNNLTLAGKTWRLPNKNELLSILDSSVALGAYTDQNHFPQSGLDFWTSSTSPAGGNVGSSINFDINPNHMNLDSKTTNKRARCVTGP